MAEVRRLQDLVAADPTGLDHRRELGTALLQLLRETDDPSLYGPALTAFEAALTKSPDDPELLTGIAAVQLGMHRFADALVTADRAIALSPGLVTAHAARVDALVELGRYDDADAAAGLMFGLASDLTTLSRVSYLAELRGQLEPAVTAMRLAASRPTAVPENAAFASALLGNLLLYSGDRAGAQAAYRSALRIVPNHAPALAGEGRLAVAEGRLDEAIRLFGDAVNVLPSAEHLIVLGDAQEAAGQADAAERSYERARARLELEASFGVAVDVDLALFEADHGDVRSALAHAKAADRQASTIGSAHAVAWALHRLGRDPDAARYLAKALRLGSIDPLLRYHAGVIEAALGQEAKARRDLALALATDPGFSATDALAARQLLATIGE